VAYETLIEKYAGVYNVPALWLAAWIQTESSFNPNALSKEESNGTRGYGLMQISSPGTAQQLGYSGDPAGLFDPDTNINLGAKLIGQLRRTYGDDVKRVYSAYNSGRPDLYLTSSEVAAHVNNLISNLSKQAYQWAATPAVQSAVGPALAAFALAGMLIYWNARR
jgi:soluble lytic murein transglycosylase-like protein